MSLIYYKKKVNYGDAQKIKVGWHALLLDWVDLRVCFCYLYANYNAQDTEPDFVIKSLGDSNNFE